MIIEEGIVIVKVGHDKKRKVKTLAGGVTNESRRNFCW